MITMLEKNSNPYSIKDRIIHIMYALAILSNAMTLVVNREGIFIYTFSFTVACIIILTRGRTIKNLTLPQILFVILVVIAFLFSMIPASSQVAKETLGDYFKWFCFVGLGSLFISNYKYDYYLIMEIHILFSIIFAPIILTTDYSQLMERANEEWMMQVYAIIPFIIASIAYLFDFRKKSFLFLAIFSLALYATMFITHTSRGAVVTVACAIFIYIIQLQIGKNISKRTMVLEFIVFLTLIYFMNDLLISIAEEITLSMDLGWAYKFLFYEDITNNRGDIYDAAISGYFSSPLYGNGIASFNNYQSYPHNLFLQMLYETGIIMFIPITYIIVKSGLVMFSVKKIAIDYRLISFLFIISIFQLMFSSFFWKRQAFWMLIWVMMYGLSKYSRPIKIERKK